MAPPVNVGQVLAGKYQIERVLGMGGMGVVVAALHLQLHERVAIKFLQAEALQSPQIVGRFLREARAAAKIRSEHVARVYDVGTLEDGAPYLVMEYLDGSDLSAVVKQRGPLPAAVAVEYVLQACEAIAEAHAAGIVHRDLKPANLFVTARADGSHVVKVIDFGISKMASDAGGAGLDMTKTTEMRGSLLFMPPEQMSRPRDADARSDIWAIGVSLFNLLTGEYPFPAESAPELCAKVFHQAPVPLRHRRPDCPPALEAVILRCLEKSPEQRFQNVAELAAALVDFAAPGARVSADRISKTLGVALGVTAAQAAPVTQYAPPGLKTAVPAQSGYGALGAITPGARSTASGPPGGEPAQTGRSTWGSTNPMEGKRRSGNAVVLVSAFGVLLVGAIVLLVVFMRPAPPEPEVASPAASAVPAIGAAGPASTGAPAISVTPAAGASAQAVDAPPSPSATTSASAPAAGQAAPPVETSKPKTGPRPTATGAPTAKPKKDLFESPL